MGFWQTGYLEFHEYSGLGDFSSEPSSPQFACPHCNKIYTSRDELRKHRIESHPLHRPTLFLRGQEVGKHPIRITQPLTTNDVRADDCDRALLNGCDIPVSTLPHRLTQISSDVCRLVLIKADVAEEFTLDFRIASEDDLKGIEERFKKTAQGKRLDGRAVEEFISATSEFGSALSYCNGICEYLYGVLAKEKTPNSSLPYEAYIGKFNKAVEDLAAYERPLARTICNLIKFHFNHFVESARLASGTRVGQAGARYAAWLQGRKNEIEPGPALNNAIRKLDALVTYRETEQIVRWAVRPFDDLSQHVSDMESFLKIADIGKYDKVKLHILLGETYAAVGDGKKALQYAKTLRNRPPFDRWAESKIRMYSEGHNEQR